MKNLRQLPIFILIICFMSCSSDDDGENTSPLNEDPGVSATIDGGTYNNYSFNDGISQIITGTNNTLSIEASDTSGEQITLFLNSTGGFDSGTVKTMGDVDSNNSVTYALIRQSNPQTSYYSTTGNVTITENRTHPTEAGIRLLSGTFNISASTINGENSTTLGGSFTELEYED
ncbi:DUF6252 family protein [Winogradskyella wichelsiae]|uniref:DUF6252 family protein n=1 Tax=Winogradskyella wichelsiae TaxID=2697007 RepID=UPI0015CA6DEE|nr:hypothetical protein [Winogradskyella wichelsiae]